MNPSITFEIQGLQGVSFFGSESQSEFQFEVSDQDNINFVTVFLENREISGIKVTFNEETFIDANLAISTFKLIELFAVSIIGEFGATTDKFRICIKNICNPIPPANDGFIEMNAAFSSSIEILPQLAGIQLFEVEQYRQLFLGFPISAEKQEAYMVLKSIMQIDNIAIRYLMQYEFFMSRILHTTSQIKAINYILNIFDPLQEDNNKIGIHEPRRTGRNYDEDEITCYRNIIGHNEGTNIPNNLEVKINKMSLAITRVIFFALKDMP